MSTRRVCVIRNGKQDYIMAKAGRKPKPNVERNGRGRIAYGHDRETPEQAQAVVISQRMRLWGATLINAKDQHWSSPLGQMRMQALVSRDDAEGLSAVQYEALKRYIMARHHHRVAQGYGSEHPKSISGEMVAGGGGFGADLDDAVVFERARNYNGARSALLGFAGRGVEYVRTVESLARDEAQERGALGIAREAANILVRHWGMA
jgi:hypothetical protein